MSRKARKRATRRDRRKARQSKWRRLPKKSGRVAHGTALTIAHIGGQS